MDQTVQFEQGKVPSWTVVKDLLAKQGLHFQTRMIDGEIAFPDEIPPEGWKELRVANQAGMITLRRQPNQVQLVIWGNADQALQQSWNALTWAFAETGGGKIATPAGLLEPATFLHTADMPPELRN